MRVAQPNEPAPVVFRAAALRRRTIKSVRYTTDAMQFTCLAGSARATARLRTASGDHHDGQLVIVKARDQSIQEAFSTQRIRNIIPAFVLASIRKLVGAIAQGEEWVFCH